MRRVLLLAAVTAIAALIGGAAYWYFEVHRPPFSRGFVPTGRFPLEEAPLYSVAADSPNWVSVIGERIDVAPADTRDDRVVLPKFVSQAPLVGIFTRFTESGLSRSSRLYLYLDESGGTGTGYDRLYFDANANRDFTDDAPVLPIKDIPEGAIPDRPWDVEWIVFDYITIPVEAVEGYPPGECRILPRLMINAKTHAGTLWLAGPSRRGKITLGDSEAEVMLLQPYQVTGRFDMNGQTYLMLWCGEYNYFGQMSNAVSIGDGVYRFSSTPSGATLLLEKYEGKTGLLAVAGQQGGGRGRLQSGYFISDKEETLLVADRLTADGKALEGVNEATLPEGNFRLAAAQLTVEGIYAYVRSNEYQEGRAPYSANNRFRYPLRIREGRPCVVDFSSEPAVVFIKPSNGLVMKPGGGVEVEAVLVDPWLDVALAALTDTNRMEEFTYKAADGSERTIERHPVLQPAVAIKDSVGKIVAEGTMPFG